MEEISANSGASAGSVTPAEYNHGEKGKNTGNDSHLATRGDRIKHSIELDVSQALLPTTRPQEDTSQPIGGQSIEDHFIDESVASLRSLVSSPLSEASSFLSSPHLDEPAYVKTEYQDSTAQSSGVTDTPRRAGNRRQKVDVCADPDMVAALQVPDTNLDTPIITSYRRVSTRLRAASISTPGSSTADTPWASQVSLTTRKRAVKTYGQGASKKVKAEVFDSNEVGQGNVPNHDILAPESRETQTASDLVVNGSVLGRDAEGSLPLLVPTQPGSNSASASKLPAKKKPRKRITYEYVAFIDPSYIPPASEPEPVLDVRRPMSLPPTFVKVGDVGTGVAVPQRNRRYSFGEDSGNLKPLEHVRTVVGKLAMYDDTPTETRLRPRKPPTAQQYKSRPNKRKRPATTQSGDDESDVHSRRVTKSQPKGATKRATTQKRPQNEYEESEAELSAEESDIENSSSTPSSSTFESVGDGLGSTPGTSAGGAMPTVGSDTQGSLNGGDAPKNRELDPQGNSAAATNVAIEQQNDGVDVRDSRVHKDAFQMINGVLCIPRGCRRCLESRAFCNRNIPCERCSRDGSRECVREPGWVVARAKTQRQGRQSEGGSTPSSLTLPSQNAVTEPLPLAKSGPGRGRPRKLEVKKEVSVVATPLPSSIDFQEGKPPGIRRPDVWCESRQELCETLPYYRSYQSGCYGHEGLVHGYLLDGFASVRDYVGGKVIISHSGGKSVADDDGQRRLLMDQTSEDKVIKYLLTNMKQKWPLVMIIGNQCVNSPSRVPYRYCVMDWFKVTAGWAERDPRSRYTRWKFRFEKLDTTTDGWWAATPSQEPDQPLEMIKASCAVCYKESPHVYEEGWACLNPHCSGFWQLNGVDMPVQLTYAEHFLHCRTQWPVDFLTPPNSLAPPLDTVATSHVESGGVTRPFWKGMCCPRCGRLSCRELWEGWKCPGCGFSYNPPRIIFDANRLADPHRPVYTGPAIPSNICSDQITSTRVIKDGMTVVQYNLGDCGTVTHILANRESNSRHEDANWLLENYQKVDMPFKRFPMKSHHSQGRLLTQQFTFNCGAPYKFIVDVNSYSFADSPRVVIRALELIHERASLVHPEANFNEVLSVGYFEKQKMDYHDDGEEGLGETVASISLGGSARMRFRVKAKFRNDRHCWTTEPEPGDRPQALVNGNSNEEIRDELGEDDEDEAIMDTLDGTHTSPPVTRSPKNSKSRAMLDLCLNHGDVMVMKGRAIQKYWEHTVIPQGLFRIAATARFISSRHPGVIEERTKKGKDERQTTPPPNDPPTSNFEAEPITSINAGAPQFTNGVVNRNTQSGPAPGDRPLDSVSRAEPTLVLPPPTTMAPVGPLVPGPLSHALGNHNTSPYTEPRAQLLSRPPAGLNMNTFSPPETRTPILFPGQSPLGSFLGHDQREQTAGYPFGQTLERHQMAVQSEETSGYSLNNRFTQSFPSGQDLFHQQSSPYQSAISYSAYQYQETLQPQPNPHAQQSSSEYLFDSTTNHTGTAPPESYNNSQNPAGYQTSPGHENNGGRPAPSAGSHTQQGWSGQRKWAWDGSYST